MPAETVGGGGLGVLAPPPGEPAAIRALAQTITRRSVAIGSASANTTRAGQALLDSACWTGEAATGYRSTTDLISRGAAALEAPAADVGTSCSRFADALDQAQRNITDAARRYDAAQRDADRLVASVNADPNRTEAQVAAAQTRIDEYDRQMSTALDDATRAWASYHAAEQAGAASIATSASELKDVPPLDELYRTLKDVNEYTDAFGSLWELAWSYGSVRNLAAVLGGQEAPVQTFETLLEQLREGNAASPAAVAEASSAVAQIQGELAGLKAAAARGTITPAELARVEALEAELPAALARLESATGGASSFATWSKVFGGASKVLSGIAIAGDVFTILDPPHDGGWGVVDQVAAGGNLLGMGIGAAAATEWGGALLAGTAIPGVGEVLVVGTGLYLAGSWLYDNWSPFHDVVDGAASGVVHAAEATGEFLSDVGGDIADGLSDAGEAVGDFFGGLFD